MSEPLRALIVEDSEDDALLVVRLLQRGGYDVAFERVETSEAMRSALTREVWEVVLCDHNLPRFDSHRALSVLQESGLDLPFLIISGSIGEETAVAAMKAGAHDFLLKERLGRLVPAVDRELREARVRRERRHAQEELRQRNRELEEINLRLRKIILATEGLTACERFDEMGSLLLREFARLMAAEGGSLFLRKGNSLVLAHSLDPGHAPVAIPLPLREDSIFGRLWAERSPVLVRDIAAEGETARSGWDGYRDGSLLAVPLPDKSGELVGIISLHNKSHPPFTQQDRDLGMILGSLSCETLKAIQVSDALRESEARYRTLFEAATDAIFVMRGTQCIDCNSQALSMFRSSREGLVGKEPWELSPPSQPDGQSSVSKGRTLIDRALAGEPQLFEWRHLRGNGTTMDTEVGLNRLEVPGGPLLIATVRDVTERRRAETQLRTFVELGQRLTEAKSAREAASIILRAADDLLGWDAAFLDHYDAAHEVCVPLLYMDTVGGDKSEVPLPIIGRNQRVVEGGARLILRGEPPIADELPRFGDLSKISASLMFVPIRRGDRSVGILSIQSYTPQAYTEDDLQILQSLAEHCGGALERIQAEEAERHSREVTAAIADASVRFIESGSLRAMARVVVEHAARITGATMGTLIVVDESAEGSQLSMHAVTEMTWTSMTGKALAEKARRSLRERGHYPLAIERGLITTPIRRGVTVLTNSPAEHSDWAGSAPEGHPPIHSFLGVPLKIAGKVVGLIALANRPGGFTAQEVHEVEAFAKAAALALRTARSEEERSKVERLLHQSQKMEAIGQLAGGIAHDFNNLLLAILGYTDFVLEDIEPGDRKRLDLEQIRLAARRAADLTRQLLAFSRQQVLHPVHLDLNRVVDDLIKMIRRLIGENILLRVRPGENLRPVQADQGQIEQVLMNLCINARDAMPGGGEITIETSNIEVSEEQSRTRLSAKPGRFTQISVSDTGCGMDEETQRRIFEPFFTTKEVGKGTGLGLATVYGIVEQHGGFLDVQSEPGEGSTFIVCLPSVDESAEAQVTPLPRPALGGTETILLAEDEEIVRSLAKRILQDSGYTVLEARDGKEALRVFAEKPESIDLAILDIVMPGLGGRAVRDKMVRRRPEVRALLMSGYSADAIPGFILDAGLEMIQKPFDAGTLLRKVREVLDS
ncbi:GAF domain-containing protein [Candidatus Sumerlaeota bacterium]|nr:GAF domain-containing protein [Candidatus Sumerlaeota bacterium]